MIERKRTLNTIKAIEAIHRLGYNVHLDVIGDGHLRSVLMEYVWKHDLHDIVMFHGILSPMEIVKVYEECDCFVLPSAGETFGWFMWKQWLQDFLLLLPVVEDLRISSMKIMVY
ncbi:MAG: glycosyltransferase [Bacteroides uniformis]|nr:glycosyltransferase [Bacteroides uniformis]